MAKNPDSFTISKLEVVFKAENDSLIVYSFTGKGQNGFGGYTATNFEYYYQIGKDYKRECVINLEEDKSLEDRAEAIYRPTRVALMEAGKDYLGEMPAEHIKATAELCLGFLGRDIE